MTDELRLAAAQARRELRRHNRLVEGRLAESLRNLAASPGKVRSDVHVFDAQLTIDADMHEDGWEIVIRQGTTERGQWFGIADESLPALIGPAAAGAFIRERELAQST